MNEPIASEQESTQPLRWPDEGIELAESDSHQPSSIRCDSTTTMRLTREEIDMLLDDREPVLESEAS
jgi:hypothetical protein